MILMIFPLLFSSSSSFDTTTTCSASGYVPNTQTVLCQSIFHLSRWFTVKIRFKISNHYQSIWFSLFLNFSKPFVSIGLSETTLRAVVEVVSGPSTIFSGEGVRLRCSVPDNHKSTWRYLWFKGSELLAQSGEHFVLWKARVKESGKFYCQGVKDTVVKDIHTLQSLPVEINVNGMITFILSPCLFNNFASWWC